MENLMKTGARYAIQIAIVVPCTLKMISVPASQLCEIN
jgi:hypothetical protein